jgi:hypothetical protein
MSCYEGLYGTDWTTLETDEAVDRAYALGVAVSLGEEHPGELDALRAEMDSASEERAIDLAYDEGHKEGHELPPPDADEATVWANLVEGETASVDPDDVPTGGRDGIPEALGQRGALDRVDLDHRDVVELPEFLEKD